MWGKLRALAILGIVGASVAHATTHVGVDTNTPQVLDNKELTGTNFFDAFRYNGKLTIQDVHSNSTNALAAHRVEYCPPSASGDITLTLPLTPAIGDTYSLVNLGGHMCNFAANAGQSVNGNSIAELVAQYTVIDCLYISSSLWFCVGDATLIPPTPTPTATPTNTPTPTATATNTPTATPTNTPTATPTNTPVPPTATPTNTPTATPTP